jgi:hypothetical protein
VKTPHALGHVDLQRTYAQPVRHVDHEARDPGEKSGRNRLAQEIKRPPSC